ncbi:glycoside hydrolase family 32 protein [Halorubellus sp. JP-L1]|uniref:glycoside hydrolase family 32 protein n=1 Tax=Halorubellus sp. JP-L1 TaxID=2715753 RepID=UPI00140C9C55|nr:glycoside hydrolase family 32 protein [Halorubellus sp. JP-L1]NHN42708.1 glycoside hydrolase family 32 protein [Halorubellus sp. JP-L1]
MADRVTADADPSEPDASKPFAPAYHAAPSEGWMNDPNGMAYVDGRYHLFYQAGKDRRRWDHATSEDLLTWTHEGTKVPDDGFQAYSGGAVVDVEDRCGFGENALVAMFTGHHDDGVEDQRLAYSANGGDDLVRHEANPIIPSEASDFRDPNPLWYEPDGSWRLVVARVNPTADRPRGIEIYESDDLVDWTYVSTYSSDGAAWECPSLYELPVVGSDETRWVMTVSVEWNHVEHHVGRFDGERFIVEEAFRADHGFDYYGAQSWANAPEGPGLQLAWMNNWAYALSVPGNGWQGAQSLPRRLTLYETADGVDLRQHPTDAVASLRDSRVASLREQPVAPDADPVGDAGVHGRTLELLATVDPGTSDSVGLAVRASTDQETRIEYDVPNEELIVDRGRSGALFAPGHYDVATGPLPRRADGSIQLRVFVDNSSVEVFANDGRHVNTNLVFPALESTGVSAFADGGTAELTAFDAYTLATHESDR